MSKIALPDGCMGLDFADGTRVDADGRGRVDVPESYARQIGKSWYGSAGVMAGGERFSFGTKKSRLCRPCKRAWNAWSETCPRCGAETTEE